MYIIKEILVNGDKYKSSKIGTILAGQISSALMGFVNYVKTYIRENNGSIMANTIEIVDINDMTQVVEPLIDTIQIYRLVDDPHKIHLYERKTEIVEQSGWAWGATKTQIHVFERKVIFELDDFNELGKSISRKSIDDADLDDTIEMVKINHGIQIPKRMTTSPMCDVLLELKESTFFKKQSIMSSQLSKIIEQSDYYLPYVNSDSESDSEYNSEYESESMSDVDTEYC